MHISLSRVFGAAAPSLVVLGSLLWPAVATSAAAAPASATRPAPSVACELHYGGDTVHVRSAPTSDPYRVPTQEIGSYYLFRLVVQDRPADLAGVHAYTYADLPQGPTLIHQFSLPWKEVSRRTGPNGFTGWQRVHEPMRDGELLYRCRVERTVVPSTAAPVRTDAPSSPHRIRLPGHGPVRLVFAGDVMLDDGPGRVIARGGDPLAPFAPWLREADVAIGNMEAPIAATSTGRPMDSKIYNFKADPTVTRVLRGRFQAMSVANNHAGDQGHAAFLETLQHLRAAGIVPFGGGADLAQAHEPLWIERADLKIAVLAYNEFKPRAFEAGPHWPGVAWSEDEQVVADIRAARRAGADVVIPFMHWGWERERQPSPRQRALAERMIAAGADAVVGGHPHVTQGAETIRGKPVIWSLGNFVFDGFEDLPAAHVGWLLQMEIDRHGVKQWRTVEAHLDREGTPHPAPESPTPQGTRGPR